MSWGYHLMGDFTACDIPSIMDYDTVVGFAKELVQVIEMVPYGEPQVVNFGTGNKAGFTLVQLIETSNICAHFCNEDGNVYLDIFSCKEFDSSKAVETFKKYFSPKNENIQVVTRQAPHI
jgi:S-adenosylmethionine decarboxylase